MTKRSRDDVNLNAALETRSKRQKLAQDEKDSEDNKEYKTITINGESDCFLSVDLLKIPFFNSKYSTNWQQNNKNNANECVIHSDVIQFGINDLKMVIIYISNHTQLSALAHYRLFSTHNNFSNMLSFLHCLDFFCLSDTLTSDILCDYYYNTHHEETITIADLCALSQLNHPLLSTTFTQLMYNIYSSTMEERVLWLKENIQKFKLDIDSGFIIKDDRDASHWFNKKINEFSVYRKYLSRDWIMISTAHPSLQRLFITNHLNDPIFINIKDILDAFCRFCTIKHTKHINNVSYNDDRKKSNILNDVKICTFPIIQFLSIFKYLLQHFDVIYKENENVWKQTKDLINLLPTILKCDLFCGLMNDDEEYKHCDRADDLRFIAIVKDEKSNDETNNNKHNLNKAVIQVYKDIINILLDSNGFDFKAMNNDLSIIETLILPIAHKILDDQYWINTLFNTATQKETILLASKLKELILDLQLNGSAVCYTYIQQIDEYLSYK